MVIFINYFHMVLQEYDLKGLCLYNGHVLQPVFNYGQHIADDRNTGVVLFVVAF